MRLVCLLDLLGPVGTAGVWDLWEEEGLEKVKRGGEGMPVWMEDTLEVEGREKTSEAGGAEGDLWAEETWLKPGPLRTVGGVSGVGGDAGEAAAAGVAAVAGEAAVGGVGG